MSIFRKSRITLPLVVNGKIVGQQVFIPTDAGIIREITVDAPKPIPRSRVYRETRRRREASGPGFTEAEFTALCELYDNRCLRCGKRKPLLPDHIIPLSRRGAHSIGNLQPLCNDCNLWKGRRIIDFRKK